jgi:DnaJ family protein C protein 7
MSSTYYDSDEDDSDDYMEQQMPDSDDEEEEEGEMPPLEMTKSAEEWKGDGNDLYRAKNYHGAIKAYGFAIQLDGEKNPPYYLNRAAAYMMTKQFNEAVDDCNTSIGLDASNAKAYFRKANALKSLFKISEAMDTWEKGLSLDATNEAARKDRDATQVSINQLDSLKAMMEENGSSSAKFRVCWQQAENMTRVFGPANREINLIRVECMLGSGKTEDAYNLSNSMMRSASGASDLELLQLRAKILCHMGDVENAVRHLQQAMRADPDNANCRAFYKYTKEMDETKKAGDDAYRAGSYDDAIEKWTKSIDMSIKAKEGFGSGYKIYMSKLYCNRAQAKNKKDDNEAAVHDCSSAIRANPRFLKAWLRRAEINFSLGGKENITQCISDYEKVAELQEQENGADDSTAKIDVKSRIKKAKVALKRAGKKDLYAILGVSQGSSEDEIKRAYKKAALKYHPDKQAKKTDAEKETALVKFKEINEAFEVLSDAEKKKKYDLGVDVEDLDNPHAGHEHHGHGRGGGGGMGGMDPDILFQMFAQQQGMGGGGGGGRRGGGGFHGF